MERNSPGRPGRIALYVLAAIGALHLLFWERWSYVRFDYLGKAQLVQRSWWGFKTSSWDLAIRPNERAENSPHWHVLVKTNDDWKWVPLELAPEP